MTIEAAGDDTLYVRCASGDGTVLELDCSDAKEQGIIRLNGYSEAVFAHPTDGDAPAFVVMLNRTEAMLIGHWLSAAAKGELPQ